MPREAQRSSCRLHFPLWATLVSDSLVESFCRVRQKLAQAQQPGISSTFGWLQRVGNATRKQQAVESLARGGGEGSPSSTCLQQSGTVSQLAIEQGGDIVRQVGCKRLFFSPAAGA